MAGVASAQTDEEPNTDEVETTDESVDQDERGDRDRDGRRGNKRGAKRAAVAEFIGIEVEELQAQLEDGLSLADIAEVNDVDPDALVDELVANVTEKLDAKVEEGRLSEEEAAERLEAKTERIEDKVFGVDDDAEADA